MTAIQFNPGIGAGHQADPDTPGTPRLTPSEWARRRRVHKEARRDDAVRNRTMGRLHRLGSDWHLIEAVQLGLGKRDAFMAIGPGGIFAVTVKSQGRQRVRLSGDVIQIDGQRPPWIAEAMVLADKVSAAFGRTAGTVIPVTPVLALAGSGLISLWGVPRRCVVMPYRELDNLLGAYGERISARTVEKLASIARHPSTADDLQLDGMATTAGGSLPRSG